MNKTGRREFLLGSFVTSFSAIGLMGEGRAAIAMSSDSTKFVVPHETQLKFSPDGSPRPFQGNTLICHLVAQSRFRDAVTAFGDALRSSAFRQKIAFTPPDSYHMTVIPGANDLDRAASGWPKDVALDAPIAECTRIIGDRVRAFRMHTDLPLRVRATGERLIGSIRLEPLDELENFKLRRLRDRLASEVLHFRQHDHDAYVFHLTLGYQLSPLTIAEETAHKLLRDRHMPDIIDAGCLIEFGNPEYCSFFDMTRFEPLQSLRT